MTPEDKKLKALIECRHLLEEIHHETITALLHEDWPKMMDMARAYQRAIVKGNIDGKD